MPFAYCHTSDGVFITVTSIASALALSLYDHLLTLDDEITMMWTRSWSLPQFLYFLVRYGVEAFLLYLGYGKPSIPLRGSVVDFP